MALPEGGPAHAHVLRLRMYWGQFLDSLMSKVKNVV
jgi:hypothetical protein